MFKFRRYGRALGSSACITAIDIVRHPSLRLLADIERHGLLDDLALAALAIAIVVRCIVLRLVMAVRSQRADRCRRRIMVRTHNPSLVHALAAVAQVLHAQSLGVHLGAHLAVAAVGVLAIAGNRDASAPEVIGAGHAVLHGFNQRFKVWDAGGKEG